MKFSPKPHTRKNLRLHQTGAASAKGRYKTCEVCGEEFLCGRYGGAVNCCLDEEKRPIKDPPCICPNCRVQK